MTDRKVNQMQHVKTFIAPNMDYLETQINKYLDTYDVTIVNTSLAGKGNSWVALVTFIEN